MWFIATALLTVLLLTVTELAVGGVEGSLAVERGGQTDLREMLDTAGYPEGCRLHYVDAEGLSCGSVSPSEFSCKHNDSVIYQHFGCFSSNEVLSFQLYYGSNRSSVEGGKMTVELLSFEVMVHESRSPLSSVSATLLYAHPTTDRSHSYQFRLVFPAELVGTCQYEVVVGDPLLSLPLSGHLSGLTNQPLPCGFVPSTPLEYDPTASDDMSSGVPHTDYVLLKVHGYTDEEGTVYVMVPLDTEELIPVEAYAAGSLLVPQITATLFPPDLLPRTTTAQYKYRFAIRPEGCVCPVHSNCLDLQETVFTSADLDAGQVAFIPNEHHINSSVIFSYRVSDVVGRQRGGGEVVISIPPRNWDKPSQRTNRGLSVAQGGYAVLDQGSIDFYVLPECRLQSRLQVITAPAHGYFAYLNGSTFRDSGIPFASLKNGSIVYINSGDGSLWDSSVLAIACSSGEPLMVFLAIRVSPPHVPSLPPSLTASFFSLVAYQHRAMPLTPSLLHIQHLPPLTYLRITAQTGTIQFINHPETLTVARTAIFPYVKTPAVAGLNYSHSFTLSDLSRQAVWYLPPRNHSSPTDVIQVSLPTLLPSSVDIEVIPVGAITDQLTLSTLGSYPILLQMTPLPLHTHSPVFLTSRYLFSTGLASSADAITYEVLFPPDYGHLCMLSLLECNSSLLQFTQLDINLQRVFYQPTSVTVRNDAFHFTVSVKGIRSYNETRHQFKMSAASVNTVVTFSDKQFWINIGSMKRIAGKYLRPYIKLLNAIRREDIVFTIRSGPRHGVLLLNQSGQLTSSFLSFTFDDVLKQLVFYKHNRSVAKYCSDSISFTVTDGDSEIEGKLEIAVKQTTDIFLTVRSNIRTLLGQTSFVFDSSDITTRSPFCEEFVTYTVVSPPSRGVLTVYSTRYDTVLQLEGNDTFTAADVGRGFLRYTLADQSSIRSNVSDGFNFITSDVISTSSDSSVPEYRQHNFPAPHHFDVIIVPTGGDIVNISIDIFHPQPLTWLANQQGYGYRFSTEHIKVEGSVVRPSDVVINVMQQPALGTIMKNESRVGLFTLEEVDAGLVWYKFNLRRLHRGVTSDSLIISIVIKSLNVHVIRNQMFSLHWSTVCFEHVNQVVEETEREVEIHIRWVTVQSKWEETCFYFESHPSRVLFFYPYSAW